MAEKAYAVEEEEEDGSSSSSSNLEVLTSEEAPDKSHHHHHHHHHHHLKKTAIEPASIHRPRLSMQEEVTRVRVRLNTKRHFALEPHCRRMRQWDGVTFCALIFTAIITPVEVAFTNSGSLKAHEIPMFVLNRLVDVVFLVDIFLQFFVAYYDENLGGILVKSRSLIARRYLRGWFPIDAVSSLPFDVINLLSTGKGGSLNLLKSLRLLRLLKLFRVIRASRILARWEAAAVFAFSYTEISMYKFFCKLLLYAHWNACVWGMVAHKDITNGWSWMLALEESQTEHRGVYRCRFGDGYADYAASDLGFDTIPYVDDAGDDARRSGSFERACVEKTYKHFDKSVVLHKYWASLYWSVYTMTGIGYGDITATRHTEVVVATLIMLSGAVFWAYMIGEFVTLVSHMDIYGNAFRQRMDELNYMMKDKKFPVHLRRRCRMFLLHSRQHHRQTNYRQLEKSMSVSLRHEVAAANNKWIRRVWYFDDVRPPFIADLSQNASSLVYAPMEVVEQPLTLFVVTSGIAARKGRVMSKWSVWGHDFMLENLDLVDMAFTAALSYLEVVGISRERMTKMLESPAHERERKLLRKAVVFYTVKAHAMRMGTERLKRRRPKSSRALISSEPWRAGKKHQPAPEGKNYETGGSADAARRRSVASLSPGKEEHVAGNSAIASISAVVHTFNSQSDDDDDDGDGGDDGDKNLLLTARGPDNVEGEDDGGDKQQDMKIVRSKLRKLDSKVTLQHERVIRIEQKLSAQMDNLSQRLETLIEGLAVPAPNASPEAHAPVSRRRNLSILSSLGKRTTAAAVVPRG
ncbi:hypothetical protein CTAYLR_007338 [Chrysophaeum taylorii]|uniref:Ion transport domain-containing protein n=1 Tax=Chrysophaeum taylorii TaxID=2483200 RepID=A0AAD7XRG6_9STRA|nr:hypothetical protein CTAYLR_007338 [Chrysophaeum taylorii]